MNKIKNNLIYYNKKEHFTEYMRNCLDFELFFKIHKNKVILFDYANTKLFPQNINEKEVLFVVKIDQEMKEYLNIDLDDTIGMKEKIKGLGLLDLVVKNQDDYLINQSTFIRVEDQ